MSAAPPPVKSGLSPLAWVLIILFGSAAILGVIVLLIPGKDDDSQPSSRPAAVSASPTKSTSLANSCPHDTDAALAAFANQAARDIYARSGKVIDSNKIAKDVMAQGRNHPRSCGELFSLYVISATYP